MRQQLPRLFWAFMLGLLSVHRILNGGAGLTQYLFRFLRFNVLEAIGALSVVITVLIGLRGEHNILVFGFFYRWSPSIVRNLSIVIPLLCG